MKKTDTSKISVRLPVQALAELTDVTGGTLSQSIITAVDAYPKYKRLRKKYKKLQRKMEAAIIAAGKSPTTTGVKVADIQKRNPREMQSCRNGCPQFQHGVCMTIVADSSMRCCKYDRSINSATTGGALSSAAEDKVIGFAQGEWQYD